jgi:putative membrane protein insertion efficiency factor
MALRKLTAYLVFAWAFLVAAPAPGASETSDSPSLSDNPIKRVLESLLIGYRSGLSRLDGPTCGFYPSCSRYANLAIQRHGPLKGIFMTGDRLLRCHPSQDPDAPRLADGRRIDWP